MNFSWKGKSAQMGIESTNRSLWILQRRILKNPTRDDRSPRNVEIQPLLWISNVVNCGTLLLSSSAPVNLAKMRSWFTIIAGKRPTLHSSRRIRLRVFFSFAKSADAHGGGEGDVVQKSSIHDCLLPHYRAGRAINEPRFITLSRAR